MLFPGTTTKVLDQYNQVVILGQVRQLFLDDVQRFPGYYQRDHLAERALYGSFYRTGDLVRQDPIDGYFYYIGREDFQIKLHGQRIELTEIERCLMKLVSACVVTKWDEHLLAYVQGRHVDIDVLSKHCRSHLPPFMIRSISIPIEQFPSNKNGKLDRRFLPEPSNLSSTLSND